MSALFAMLASKPVPGRVKPGLAACLGAPSSAKLYRSFIMDVCERFAQLSVPERGLPAASHTLAVARNVLSGEVKYFMLNVPDALPFTLELICTIAWSGGLGLALQPFPWYGKVAERP